MKRKKLVLLFSVLTLCFVFVSCSDSVNLDPELIFEISTNKTIYRVNDKISVRMVLRYQGVEPILVNRRLGVTPLNLPECANSVNLSITNPLGNILKYRSRINIGCPKPKDFVILNSGEEILKSQRIDEHFHFDKVGIYTIQAAYNNTSDHPDGRDAWKGTVESNVITIRITPW
ncbi:MAG: hypothetical protein E3J88_06820 [Anaerolineales bacterium]|nr:MAG: hypothetical protein E3J88_06820 [Anaerolineales bacterium]